MFSEEHKLEIVKKHLDDGISLTRLARDYHIDKGSIQKWRDLLSFPVCCEYGS